MGAIWQGGLTDANERVSTLLLNRQPWHKVESVLVSWWKISSQRKW